MVAALTIPSIVSRYEKRTIEAGLKKTYAELENWIRRAEEDFGPFDSWDFLNNNTKEIVNRYFEPYMDLTPCGKYAQSAKVKYCMVTNGAYSTWYKPTETSAPGELETSGQHMPKYILPDGRVFGVYTTYYSDWATPGKSITIFVDVNGPRGKTVMGQDVFAFSICNYRGIKNRIKSGTAEAQSENYANEYLRENCTKTVPGVVWQGSACVHLLERNGWEFPKDYPIKF